MRKFICLIDILVYFYTFFHFKQFIFSFKKLKFYFKFKILHLIIYISENHINELGELLGVTGFIYMFQG